MDRRKLLSGAGLIATAGAATAALGTLAVTRSKIRSGNGDSVSPNTDGIASPAIITGKRHLKLVTTWPKNFPGLGMSPERIAARITEMTDGALDIKVYAAGELVGGLFYENYPGGSGLMAGAVFGKLAGESAAAFSNGKIAAA